MASGDHMASQSESEVVFQGPVMTTAEAAAYLRICRRTLQRWTARGLVKRYDLRLDGRSSRPLWRYRREDLDQLLLQGNPDSPAAISCGAPRASSSPAGL